MLTSPDFCIFVGSLIPQHQAWLVTNPAATGAQFFDPIYNLVLSGDLVILISQKLDFQADGLYTC